MSLLHLGFGLRRQKSATADEGRRTRIPKILEIPAHQSSDAIRAKFSRGSSLLRPHLHSGFGRARYLKKVLLPIEALMQSEQSLAAVAQAVEHSSEKAGVVSASLTRGTLHQKKERLINSLH